MGVFVNWIALEEAPATGALVQALETADWDQFVASRDLPALRERLRHLEKTDGVTALHRQVSEKLRACGAELRHRFAHTLEHGALGLSPDGRYFATGSWVGSDYEKGGTLQIWEVESGRAVNSLHSIRGGVGWPGYNGCIQWSPDSQRLGVTHDTNAVGNFDPFGVSNEPTNYVSVTDGWDSPPAWCWHPSGEALAIGCWGPSPIPGCIAALKAKQLYEGDVRWFAPQINEVHHDDSGKPPSLQPPTWLRFAHDGGRLFGYDGGRHATAVDAASGELLWAVRVGEHVAFSPDDRVFAHDPAGLVFYDARTGMPLELPMVVGVSDLVWSPDTASNQLAMVVEKQNNFGAEPGVHIFAAESYLGSFDINPGAPGRTWNDTDAHVLVWAPDGSRLACLSETGQVHFYRPDAEPEFLGKLQVSPRTASIFWGAGDTLICAGKGVVEFWDIATMALRTSYDHARALEAYGDVYEQVPQHFVAPSGAPDGRVRLDPHFALADDEHTAWVSALPSGLVICPQQFQSYLPGELHWSIDHRYSWPVEWGDLQVFSSVQEALKAGAIGGDEVPGDALHQAAQNEDARVARSAPTQLMLGGTASLDALFETFDESLRLYAQEEPDGYADQLRRPAMILRAALQPAADLDALVGEFSDTYELVSALAQLVMADSRSGNTARAQHAWSMVGALRTADSSLLTNIRQAASVAGAAGAMQDPEAAELIETARASLREWSEFEDYALLAMAHMAAGEFDQAEETLMTAPVPYWMGEIETQLFTRLIEDGEIERVRRLLDWLQKKGGEIQDYDFAGGIVQALMKAGEYARAWELLPLFHHLPTADYRIEILDRMMQTEKKASARTLLSDYLTVHAEDVGALLAISPAVIRHGDELADALASDLLERVAEVCELSDADKALQQWGALMGATGRVDAARGALEQFSPPAHQFAALCGIASQIDREIDVLIMLEDAVSYIAHTVEDPFPFYLTAAQAAARARADIPMDSWFDLALELAMDGARDKRFALGALMRACLTVGEFQRAYRAYQKHTPDTRLFEVGPLVDALAHARQFTALVDLLETLPASDLNGRPSHALRALKIAAA